MRIAVIGAGIVGVTTAYELAADGHEVVVFERHAAVATQTSFANAGVLAPGYVTPWAAPGMPWKIFSQLLGRHAPVRLAGMGALRHASWIWQWWRACRRSVHERNRGAMQRLAHFSRAHQLELTRQLSLEYEHSNGYMVLLRSARDVARAQAGLKLLNELGVAHEWVDGARARSIEPALNPATPLQGAIHLPQDGAGNCRQFAHLMKAQAQHLGVNFRFEQRVTRILPGAQVQLVLGDERSQGDTQIDAPRAFDSVVICAGHEAPALLKPLGLRLPIVPIWGYSLTAPLRHVDSQHDYAPRSAVMDEKYKVAITRMGKRVRVAGSAELGGTANRFNEAAMRTLYRVLDDWYPGAAHMAQAQPWKGARPMLPDGPPLLGASGVPGVWLNVGHGSSGWALSCGSARVVAELVAGRSAPLDTTGLDLSRLR